MSSGKGGSECLEPETQLLRAHLFIVAVGERELGVAGPGEQGTQPHRVSGRSRCPTNAKAVPNPLCLPASPSTVSTFRRTRSPSQSRQLMSPPLSAAAAGELAEKQSAGRHGGPLSVKGLSLPGAMR